MDVSLTTIIEMMKWYPQKSWAVSNHFLADTIQFLPVFVLLVMTCVILVITRNAELWKAYFPLAKINWKQLLVITLATAVIVGTISHFSSDATNGLDKQLHTTYANPYLWLRTLVLYPIIEEIFIRVLLLGTLLKFIDLSFKEKGKFYYGAVLIAVILQAVFFAMLHPQYQLTTMFFVFLVGFSFGIIRVLSKNMFASIYSHSITNLIANFSNYLLL